MNQRKRSAALIVFTLICVVLSGFLTYLGFWQIHRYHWKKNLVEQFNTQAMQHYEPLQNKSYKEFTRVMSVGRYLPTMTILLDHKTHDGRLGYEVLTPFQAEHQQKVILVDRGFLDRARLSELTTPTQTVGIKGYIKYLPKYEFILGLNILDEQGKPLIAQKIDLKDFARVTGKNYFPFFIRLNTNEPYGYVRDWPIVNLIPQQHLGYALQWFGLALVIVIGYVVFIIKSRKSGLKS